MMRVVNQVKALLSLVVVMLVLCGAIGLASAQAVPVNVPLSWNANAEPDLGGYKVYQRTATGAYGVAIATLGKVTSYNVAVTPGTVTQTLFWVITAYDTGGLESGQSNEVSQVIAGVPPTPPPGTPILSVNVTSPTTATAIFPPVPDGLGGNAFVGVRIAVAPISWGSAADVPCTGSPCLITGLTPGTKYQSQAVGWRIVAGKNIFGAISAPIDFTTPLVDTPPANPSGLKIQSQTSSEIVIMAAIADCPHVTTSTIGSTKAVNKRTVKCAP